MRLRLIVPPILVLAAAGALLLLQDRPGPGGGGEAGSRMVDVAPARKGPPKGSWTPWPVHPESLPRTEAVPARVRCPEPVSLSCALRSPFEEVPVREGSAVRKGELLARVSVASYERAVAAARTDEERRRADRRLQEAMEQARILAPADGIVFRLDARLGELPPRGREGPKPCVVLLDWKALVIEGTATGATADLVRGGAGLLIRLPGDDRLPAEKVREPVPAAGGGLDLAVRPVAAPGVVPVPGGEASILVLAGTREGFSIPAAAVFVEDARRIAWVVTVRGELERREVVVGERLPGERLEVAGVRTGESVAVWEGAGK